MGCISDAGVPRQQPLLEQVANVRNVLFKTLKKKNQAGVLLSSLHSASYALH